MYKSTVTLCLTGCPSCANQEHHRISGDEADPGPMGMTQKMCHELGQDTTKGSSSIASCLELRSHSSELE
jgi:hypothetical protein